jgi:hypothetical protein
MRRPRRWLGTGVATCLAMAGVAIAANAPDAHDPVPPGWTGPVFRLSQTYPTSLPAIGPAPWRSINFRTQSVPYLNAVIRYALEGNVAVDFRGQDNTVRKWFHAPWMHRGPTAGSSSTG